MFDEEPPVTSGLVLHAAVRGQKSVDYGNLSGTTLGDSGLLADMLLTEPVSKKYKLGIVPHLWHLDEPVLLTLMHDNPQLRLIDVRDDPIAVIKQIAQCEFVFSSSLHGLIVADSMNVPNQWVQFSKPLFGGSWKFLDYYSVFNMNLEPYMMTADVDINDLANNTAGDYARPDLQTIKTKLLASFPKL